MRNLVVRLLALFRRVSLLVLKLRGKTPADAAAQRVVSGRAWDDMGGHSGVYLHLMQEKNPSPLASDEAAGARLWEASEALLTKHAPLHEASPCSST